jgi:hypothetical protein
MPIKLPEPSRIEFHGPGPFDLPVAQSVAARPVDDTVVLTFRVLARSNQLEVVRIAVPSSQARGLAVEISSAALRRRRR